MKHYLILGRLVYDANDHTALSKDACVSITIDNEYSNSYGLPATRIISWCLLKTYNFLFIPISGLLQIKPSYFEDGEIPAMDFEIELTPELYNQFVEDNNAN